MKTFLRVIVYAFFAAATFLLMLLFTSGCSIGIYRDWRGRPENRTTGPEPIVKVWTARCERMAVEAARYGVNTRKLRAEYVRLCVIELAQADFQRARRTE